MGVSKCNPLGEFSLDRIKVILIKGCTKKSIANMAVQKMAVHQSSPPVPCMQSSECILQCAMDSLFTVLFKT